MVKKAATFIILLSWVILSASGYCQDSGQEGVKRLTGRVADIDWVGRKLVVDAAYPESPNEMTFAIPEDAKIIKGSEVIWFSDINVSDPVTVEYLDNSPEELKVLNISVNEH